MIRLLPCLNDSTIPFFLKLFKCIGIKSVNYQLLSISREQWHSFVKQLTKHHTYKESLIKSVFNDSLYCKQQDTLDIDEQYKKIIDCRFKANCKKLALSLVPSLPSLPNSQGSQLALI